jgi:glutaminyl-peptide cyclotransferase
MNRKVLLGLIIVVGIALIAIPLYLNNKKEAIENAVFEEVGDIQTIYKKDLVFHYTFPEGIERVEIIYNDVVVQTSTAKGMVRIDCEKYGVGSFDLTLRTYFPDNTVLEDRKIIRVVSDIAPILKTIKIGKTFPHDVTNYTQGLEFSEGKLFESTGDPGKLGNSKVGQYEFSTGTFSIKNGLDASYFGEGISILGNKVYQLTWQNSKCFVYDKNTLVPLKQEFNYEGEGWGLCNNGKELIMSNGTEFITFRDPNTFTVNRTIQVYDNVAPRVQLNELEYANGFIYANVWQTNLILVIDPKSGKVLEEIDAKAMTDSGKGTVGDVLNGIAYNPSSKTFFITGKYFNKLAEVTFVAR